MDSLIVQVVTWWCLIKIASLFMKCMKKGVGLGETLFIKGKIDIFITRAGGWGQEAREINS